MFEKGKSGNPGGRPKVDINLRELARENTVEALNIIIDLMRNEETPPQVRYSAAVHVLDRGHGKPAQQLEHVGKDGEALPETINIMEAARNIAFLLNKADRIATEEDTATKTTH